MDGPASVYMNGLGYYWNRDPQPQEPTIQDFVIANFDSNNEVVWKNTATLTRFLLYNIINAVYDDSGKIISGDLQWLKYSFSATLPA